MVICVDYNNRMVVTEKFLPLTFNAEMQRIEQQKERPELSPTANLT